MRSPVHRIAASVWLALAGLGGLAGLVGGCAPPPEPPDPAAATQPDRTAPLMPIAEADALFHRAYAAYTRLREAAELDESRSRAVLDAFLDLLERYPQSDKVDDAYFFCGRLLEEPFNRSEEAAEYFRLAYQADPHTARPARFQRARVLDFRLNRHEEAVEEYRRVIQEQTGRGALADRTQLDFAASRIRVLTGQSDPADPPPADLGPGLTN